MIFLDLLTLVTFNLKAVGISLQVVVDSTIDVRLRNIHTDLACSYLTIDKIIGHIECS